jgi:ATP-dependent DNA helicase Q1
LKADEQYFSTSAQLSTNAWDHGDTLTGSASGSVASCGSCDNCLRSPDSITTKDVTLETWRILKVVQEVERNSGRATLANISDLARGLGSASYTGTSSGGNSKKRKADPEKASMDTTSVAGGKITLNKEVRTTHCDTAPDTQDTETLLIHLTLLGYLRDCK